MPGTTSKMDSRTYLRLDGNSFVVDWKSRPGFSSLLRIPRWSVEQQRSESLSYQKGREIRKWAMNAFHSQDSSRDLATDHAEAGISGMYLGAMYQKRKDPQHLRPTSLHHVAVLSCLNRGLTSSPKSDISKLEKTFGESRDGFRIIGKLHSGDSLVAGLGSGGRLVFGLDASAVRNMGYRGDVLAARGN